MAEKIQRAVVLAREENPEEQIEKLLQPVAYASKNNPLAVFAFK